MTISDHSKSLVKEASILAFEASVAFDELMHIVGCEIVVAVIKKCQGSKSAAAKRLRVSRSTVQRWASEAGELGLEVPRWKTPRKRPISVPKLYQECAREVSR